jgi:hypothetical protein
MGTDFESLFWRSAHFGVEVKQIENNKKKEERNKNK